MSIGARRLLRGATHQQQGGIPSSYSFASSGITGGGFQNAVAVSPFLNSQSQRPYILAADISCLHYSVDGAQSWHPVGNVGENMSAVMWSDVTPGECYAAANEGLYRSTDFGVTWSGISEPTNYDQDANGDYHIGGVEQPRSTGNMLAQDNSGSTKYLWVATATQGVQRRDSGTWISSTALQGRHLRGIASDPNNPDILYAAVADDGATSTSGIYRSTNARGSMTFAKMSDYPPTLNSGVQYVEELYIIDDGGTSSVYVAGNNDGMYCYSGGSWTSLNTGIDTGGGSGGPKWLGVTGYKDTSSGNIILYASSVQGVQDSSTPKRRRVIMRSANGGTSWTAISIATNSTVDYTVYGTSVTSWFEPEAYQNFAQTAQWAGANIAVDPDRTDQLIIAGRGGVWMGTLISGSWKWQPAHNGLMVTVNKTVVADPVRPTNVVWSNGDHVCLTSPDHGTSILFNPSPYPAGASDIKGDVVAFDAQDGTLYLSTSPRDTGNGIGAVASNSNPYAPGGGTWVDEVLPVQNDVPSLGVGRDGSGNRVILAALTDDGFYRKSGSTWTQITGGPFPTGNTNNGSFAWQNNGPVVYCITDTPGVWRSNTAGTQGSWIKIHNAVGAYSPTDTLKVDPINSSYLYISWGGTVYRISNADTSTGTGNSVVDTLSVSNSGPMAVSSQGWLFVHDNSGKLWRSLNPRAATPTFTSVADAFYDAACPTTRTLAISSDGYVYTGDSGRGAAVGTPVY